MKTHQRFAVILYEKNNYFKKCYRIRLHRENFFIEIVLYIENMNEYMVKVYLSRSIHTI